MRKKTKPYTIDLKTVSLRALFSCMKVVLKQDAKGLGKEGESMVVSDGYARNYLIPRGIAVPADNPTLEHYAKQAKQQKAQQKEALEKEHALRDQLAGKTIEVHVDNVAKGGKLFGALSVSDVHAAIHDQLAIVIPEKSIVIPEPIKSLGDHKVVIKLNTLTINVNLRIEENRE